jgi:hypothetical protein
MSMKDGNGFVRAAVIVPNEIVGDISLHPAWRAFLRYCRELGHGEIERLKIQNGLPVLAEVVKEKIKFTS